MKMKRVLACALSAAMIVTLRSHLAIWELEWYMLAVDIENESVTVEEKVLKEIESEVLKANAKANSEQKPAVGDNDLPALGYSMTLHELLRIAVRRYRRKKEVDLVQRQFICKYQNLFRHTVRYVRP